MKIIYYIRLIKFRYHISFIVVILGTLTFASSPFYMSIWPLLITYVSFNVLLYGGLYTLNDIVDVESDRSHPVKKNRPLAAKHISITSAYIFALSLILAGLFVAYFYFGVNIFLLYLSFILVNQIYTRIVKKIPYVEILFNALTYPMRFLLGIALVSSTIPCLLLLAVLSIACGIGFLRRTLEKKFPGWQARSVLKYYNDKKLIIFQVAMLGSIITISIIDYPFYVILYCAIVALYLVFLIGVYFSNRFAGFCRWLWLN